MKKIIKYFAWFGLLFLWVVLLFRKQEDLDMSLVYVSLIIKGRKKFSDVPDRLKDEVRSYLIDMELEYLIDEE